MKIERVDSYNDIRFKKHILCQHGAFLVDDKYACEFEIINDEEAIIYHNDIPDIIKVIDEFRFYTEHIIRFYDNDKKLIVEYEPLAIFWLDIEKIQPSQIYISQEKVDAISAFINDEFDIVIPIAIIGEEFVSLDGHTRLFYAHQKGFRKVRAFMTEYDEVISKFVVEARNRNIFEIRDMQLLTHQDYIERWYSLCDLINQKELKN